MFGLSFLSPLFLLGMAAAAIPIAIHLFQRRTDPVIEFGAIRFLRRAPVEQSHRRWLREMILLALRVSALLLLALAFARPYFAEPAAALSAPATVVLVDTSVSMSAPGQFERARERAAAAIRDAAPGGSVGVLSFGDSAAEIAPLGDDRAAALAAVAQLQAGAGATRYRAALGRAGELLRGRSGRIVVVTDLQQTGWDAVDEGAVPEGIQIEVADVGGPDANLAITALRVEAKDAVAFVQNFSPQPATDRVRFTLDGKAVTEEPVTVAAGGVSEVRVALPSASGALAAAIGDPQGYAGDNVRYALVDAGAAPLVLAVTASGHPSESLYLDRALRIAEGAGGFRMRAVSGPAFSDLMPSEIQGTHVIVLLGTRGIEQRGRELLAGHLEAGGGLLVTAGPDVDVAIVRQALQHAVQTSWQPRDAGALRFAPADSRHPVFRVFGGVGTLGNVTFTRSALLQPGEAAHVVARYSDGTPALVEEAAGEARVLVFASDLNNAWNDFPLQPAFVPFVHETLRYLAAVRQAPSEYMVGALPGEQGRVPGIVNVGARRVAVNVDPRESDPSRMTVDAFTSGVSRLTGEAERQAAADGRSGAEGQRLWQFALLLMIASVAAEGFLGRRLG